MDPSTLALFFTAHLETPMNLQILIKTKPWITHDFNQILIYKFICLITYFIGGPVQYRWMYSWIFEEMIYFNKWI